MANTQNLDLVKPLGTDHALVSVLNSNSDKIDAYAGAVNASLDGLRDGLGILADGNTHAAITSGQFVYVKNHQTLPQGLYQATTNIAANGTLSTSNLTADPNGGLNTLSEQIGNLSNGKTNFQTIWLALAKNGGSATWNVELTSVKVGILMIVGQWNTYWRYMGMVYRNDAGSGLFDIITSNHISVSISEDTITITNNNAENAQNVRATLFG